MFEAFSHDYAGAGQGADSIGAATADHNGEKTP
jgi:hypothetical protein